MPWLYGLPICPKPIDVAMVKPAADQSACVLGGFLHEHLQERIKSREFRSEELPSTATVPVDAVVNLLQTQASICSRSEIGKVFRHRKNVVLDGVSRDPQLLRRQLTSQDLYGLSAIASSADNG